MALFCSGLDWLVALYEENVNGILADEIGLGKTIQTIALFAYLAEYKNIWGKHLLVVPESAVVNWQAEFLRWAPKLKIICYHGTKKEREVSHAALLTLTSTNVFVFVLFRKNDMF